MAGKTALNVYCAINGLTNHDFDTKISSLSSPRFKLEPGKVHYIGDFELDGHMNLLSYGRRPENAAKALAAFPNIKGSIVQTRFQENFSLELKNRLWVKC